MARFGRSFPVPHGAAVPAWLENTIVTTVYGAATVTASASVGAAAVVTELGAASPAASSTVSVAGVVTNLATAAPAASTSVSAAGLASASGIASPSATASVSAAAVVTQFRQQYQRPSQPFPHRDLSRGGYRIARICRQRERLGLLTLLAAASAASTTSVVAAGSTAMLGARTLSPSRP